MTDNSKFSNDLSSAKNFFKKRLKESKQKPKDIIEKGFRDLDKETLKIGELSARIDILKQSLKKKPIFREKKRTYLKKEKKNLDDKKFEKSKKNIDINGLPLRNYIFKGDLNSNKECVVLIDFEINEKLYLSGNINKIPSEMIKILINDDVIKLKNDIIKDKLIKNNSFLVKETFGISEIKRSKLRNKKNLK